MSTNANPKTMKPRRPINILEITCYVLAIIFVIFAILFWVRVFDGVWPGIKLFASGVAIIIIGLILNGLNLKRKDKVSKSISFIELLILGLGALFGFIIPSFIRDYEFNLGGPDLWLAIILILHAVIRLSLTKYQSFKLNVFYFYLNIAFLILGGYLIRSKFIESNIRIIIVTICFAIAAVLAFKALQIGNKASKQFRDQQEGRTSIQEKPSESEEVKAPPKPTKADKKAKRLEKKNEKRLLKADKQNEETSEEES